MTAAALLAELRSRGVELVPWGDRVRFRPASIVTPYLRERLREHKAEVLAMLITPAPAPFDLGRGERSYAAPWPDSVPGLGARTVGPFESCQGCGRGSWIRYGDLVLCLACADRAGGGG